jgi:hypothetical protein
MVEILAVYSFLTRILLPVIKGNLIMKIRNFAGNTLAFGRNNPKNFQPHSSQLNP